MPTYQYHCSHCNHEFEKFQSITAEPLKKCPECRNNTLKKVITGGAGLIFKGSGFYITDYKKSDKTGTKQKESVPKVKKDANSKPEKKPRQVN